MLVGRSLSVQVSLSAAEMKPVVPTETNDPYGVSIVPLNDLTRGTLTGGSRTPSQVKMSLECPVLPGDFVM